MQELKKLSENQKDLIKAQIGGSKLYLKAISSHKVFRGTVNKLILEFGNKYLLEIENIVACTVSAIKKGDLGFSYTRDKNKYTLFNSTVINRPPSSYRRTIALLSKLEQNDYITLYKGYKDKAADDSMAACCVFQDKLINLFDSKLIDKFGKEVWESSVEVRDGDGNVLFTEGQEKLERKVNGVNKWLSKHKFFFGAYPKKIYLQRVFKYDLRTSGRFYFGEYQTIKSYKRKSFRIGEEHVAELDFSSQHFAILAGMVGHEFEKDFKPYEIDISDLVEMQDGYCPKKARKILKLACLLLINSGNPATSFKNAWDNNRDTITKLLDNKQFSKAKENIFYGISGKRNVSKIICRLKEHNSYAETFFNRKGGMWGECQYLDSEIMLQILIEMKKLDKPIIPYHDSCVCRVSDVEYLEFAMRSAWKKVLGNDFNCRIERKF